MNGRDDEMQELFDGLREHDSRDRPDFSAMVRRTESRGTLAGRRAPSLEWAALAACILLAAALLIGRTGQKSEWRLASSAASISDWESPTAALLETPARHVLAPPALLSSVLDGVAAPVYAGVHPKSD